MGVQKKMFLFACIVLFLISKSSGCPDEPGWIPVGDFGCYLMSQEEHNILDQFLVHAVSHWIGLTDLSEEGTYLWWESHTEANYTNWATDQPDNSSYHKTEDCVVLSYDTKLDVDHYYGWYISDCHDDTSSTYGKKHALCKINV